MAPATVYVCNIRPADFDNSCDAYPTSRGTIAGLLAAGWSWVGGTTPEPGLSSSKYSVDSTGDASHIILRAGGASYTGGNRYGGGGRVDGEQSLGGSEPFWPSQPTGNFCMKQSFGSA